MLERLYQKLESKASRATVALLFGGFVIFAPLFQIRNNALQCQNKTLDGRFGGYNENDVLELFRIFGSSESKVLGRYVINNLNLYAITELTLDVVFPLVYSLLLICLFIRLYSKDKAKYLILLPILAALSDLSENFTIAYLAFSFDNHISPISTLAATFTSLKWGLLVICLLVLICGALLTLFKKENQ